MGHFLLIMMGKGAFAALLALSFAHNILQLTDEKTPLRVESEVAVDLSTSQCLQPLSSYTLSGWFKADSAVPQRLLSISTPSLSLTFDINSQSQLLVSIGILGQSVVPLQGRLDWHHFAFSVSGQSQRVSLSLRNAEGKETTVELPLVTPVLDLTLAHITLGDSSVDFLDLTLVPIALSPSEAYELSPFPTVLPLSSHSLSIPPSVCLAEGLMALKQKYNDEDLHSSWQWEFGLSIFGWDYEDFGVNFSTVKAVFELNDVMGDPDMEIYVYHLFDPNEYLGESKKVGPDTFTVDWNMPQFRNGIDWNTSFRVYIEGKSWFNWYSVYCTIYSIDWYRVSNGQALGLHQTVEKRSNSGWWGLSLGLAGLGVFLVYRQKRKREAGNEALLERLLVPN